MTLEETIDDTFCDYRSLETKTIVKSLTPNPYLELMVSDHLYHLALSTSTHNLQEMFGDVQFVCVGGTSKRMLCQKMIHVERRIVMNW